MPEKKQSVKRSVFMYESSSKKLFVYRLPNDFAVDAKARDLLIGRVNVEDACLGAVRGKSHVEDFCQHGHFKR